MSENTENSTGALQDKFARLQHEYLETAAEKIDRISELAERQRLERSHLQRLYELVHSIKGSAGTYGFAELSNSAAQMCHTIERVLQRDESAFPLDSAEQFDELTEHYWVLSDELEAARNSNPPRPSPSIDSSENGEANRILFIQDEVDEAVGLVRQLEHFGYEVSHVPDVADLEDMVRQNHLDAIIIDAESAGKSKGGIERLKQLETDGVSLPPILFKSPMDSLEARLEAVRAGADDYLAKPVDVSRLVNRLEVLLGGPDTQRVLIIDDDAKLAEWYSNILAEHGLDPEIVTQAPETLEAVRKYQPDLILLDLHMPECSGRELAAVIRQASVGTGVPIVFLSAEEDRQQQLACLLEGGNEFITKPIRPEHLVAVVDAHLKHGRQIRRRIRRDSLTGLYNHAESKSLLRHELHRARREHSDLSLAILDLDNFKSVNDNYGHLIGDSVLRTVAQLCRRRLRRTDTVGRIGGEEFCIIMPETPPEDARRVVDELRKTFGAIEHKTDQGTVCVTFSFGIAGHPDYMQSQKLWQAADKALYRAKNNGKNRGAMAPAGQNDED